MKKIIILILFVLSVIPFPFWKMECDPCCQYYELFHEIYHHSNEVGACSISPPTMLKNDSLVWSFTGIHYIFSYNKETGYAIAYAYADPGDYIETCIKFFRKGDPSIFNHLDLPSFVFIEEIPNLKMTYNNDFWMTDKKDVTFWGDELSLWTEKNCFNPQGMLITGLFKGTKLFLDNYSIKKDRNLVLKEEFLKERAVKLSTEFKTFSGVVISNKGDKVEISQEGKKPKDFQKALQDYFDIDNRNTRLATNWQSSKSISARLLNSLYSFRPSSQQIDLLNNSQILSVFGTFKKNRIESIIWGFAKDKETGEKFHWITDLKTDISFLLNE